MNPKRREGKIEGEKSTKNLHVNTAWVNGTEGGGSSWIGVSVRLVEPEINFAHNYNGQAFLRQGLRGKMVHTI